MRKNRLAARLVVGAVLLGASLRTTAAPAPPNARAVLARVHDAYASSPSFTSNFVQTYRPAGFGDTSPETGHLVLQPPDQVRFEYDGADGKLFTFDGETARQYVAADKQMIVKRLDESERARLPLLFFESPERVLTRFDAEARAAENGLTELTLSPKKGDDPKSIALLLAESGEVKRLVVLDASGNRTTFTFTQRTAGKKRPASDFALEPPKGTKVVTD